MRTPVRIAVFLTALVAVFAAALSAGRLGGPVDVAEDPAAHEDDSTHASDGEPPEEEAHGDGAHEDETSEDAATTAADIPGGLQVSADGYALELEESTLPAGTSVPLRFRVVGPAGEPVTSYDVEHEKRLHLIVVRRDFRGFQHVHPTMSADGTWAIDVALKPGTWRVLADFVPTGGEGLTLGADLSVSGAFQPAGPAPDQLTDTVAGYTVTLSGDLTVGAASDVTVTVERDGRKVTDLQPYLGAYGHLVALREGDLAYLHVHPEEAGPGPDVPFIVEVPSPGRYRLFFDFQHDGEVRTASFVVGTDGPANASKAPEAPEAPEEEEPHGH